MPSTHIRGIYLTAYALDRLLREGRLEEFVARMQQCGLNALVFNVKNMHGQVLFATGNELAHRIGAAAGLLDLPEVVEGLHAHGLYVIARQVLFYDPVLAAHLRSPLAPWVPPDDPQAVDYNLAIAAEVARSGVDELQFDYLRWPDDGPFAAQPDYAVRYATIEDFLQQARALLGVRISIDVFGRTLWGWNKKRIDPIGQDLEAIAPYVTVISPMVYPSHYELELRDKPYETVKRALASGLERGLRLRPFLQAFAMELPPGMTLREYIREELRALQEVGIREYLFWNPDADYADLFAALCGR